ncbi:O-antigen ligase [uncultured Aquabacterium sp.]|uniref:O-antigen ligase family protein n=1 Tax=Aquabacterium sp. TaxID=1872578 RepID=UPI0025E087B9|nr:O-antigen ligase family protein [uncultured Aquabacterium sp.]
MNTMTMWRSRVAALTWPSWSDVGLFALFGLVLPALCFYFLVGSPFVGLVVLRYALLVLVLLAGFSFAAPDAPWYVRMVLSVTLGQLVLNYGFTNIVVGAGAAKITLAEGACLLALVILLPMTYRWLSKTPAFWLAMAALILPPAYHLYRDFFEYRMAALRDVLTVVDIVFFVAGMAVVALGVHRGVWLAWRDRFLRIWFVAGGLYCLTWPISPWIKAISPSFSSYQQAVPVLGAHVTSPYTAIAVLVAWFAIPHVFPRRTWVRTLWIALVLVETILVVVMAQSRNLYLIILCLPVVLGFFGYKRAFSAVAAGMVALVMVLALVETLNIKIPGRISDVTLSAVVDRFLSISGKHGDEYGATGVQQRMVWWASSLDMWRASPDRMVFGVGYGPALTNFMSPGENGEGVVVREPHNSFISSLVRGGIVYFGLWGAVVLGSMRRAWLGARLPGLGEDDAGHFKGFAAWGFILMGMLLLTSLSEPNFESPSIAAMFYIVAGMVSMEYYIVTRRVEIRPGAGRATGV